jgi:hypothetical protein
MGVDDEPELTATDKGYLRREYVRGTGVDPAPDRAGLNAKILETLVLNEEMKGDAHAIGQQNRRSIVGEKTQQEAQKKDREWTWFMMQALRQNIAAARNTLHELTDMIDLRLEEARTHQALKQQELHEVTDSLKAIHQGMERLERGEALEVENGKLKDAALEAVIKHYEEKTGQPVDRENPASILRVLKEVNPEYKHKQKRLEKYLDVYKDEIDAYEKSHKSAIRLQEEGEGIEDKSPEEQKAWLDQVDALKKGTADKFKQFDATKQRLDSASNGGNTEPVRDLPTRPDNAAPIPLKMDF